jgi:hypothetical protein
MAPNIISAVVGEYCIEIKYKKFFPGTGYKFLIDFLYADPIGGWSELHFEDDDCCEYACFLETMVDKNIEVYKKLSKLYLDSVLEEHGRHRIKLLNAISILDPTFIPPGVNTWCRWQREMMEEIIRSSYHVIITCRNENNLRRYAKALKALQ